MGAYDTCQLACPFYDLHSAVFYYSLFFTHFYWQDIKIITAFTIDRKEGIKNRKLYNCTDSIFLHLFHTQTETEEWKISSYRNKTCFFHTTEFSYY